MQHLPTALADCAPAGIGELRELEGMSDAVHDVSPDSVAGSVLAVDHELAPSPDEAQIHEMISPLRLETQCVPAGRWGGRGDEGGEGGDEGGDRVL